MTQVRSALLRDYLKRLDRATRDLPRARRGELRVEIEEHLAEAIPEDATDSEIERTLGQLGEPEQIAEEERLRLGVKSLPGPTWTHFCLWAVFGAMIVFAYFAAGPYALVLLLFGAWVAKRRPDLRRSAVGLLAGIGAFLLYIAYIAYRLEGRLPDRWSNAWPWLFSGLALVSVSLLAQLRMRR